MNAELWAAIGTILGTVFLLIVPGVVYAYYVLEAWIGSSNTYPDV
jgi:LPS O-antigen subunit length determinant protein (WzzB/FepE family)